MSNSITKGLAAELKWRFPWLGTNDDAGSGADVISELASWYNELTEPDSNDKQNARPICEAADCGATDNLTLLACSGGATGDIYACPTHYIEHLNAYDEGAETDGCQACTERDQDVTL